MNNIRIEKVKFNGSDMIKLASPYHRDLPARAKALGGRFSPEEKAWYFDVRDEARVRALAQEIYGTDGSPVSATDLVTLRVSFPAGYHDNSGNLFVAGRSLARAFGPKSEVKLGEGVILVQGAIYPQGGRSHWWIKIEAGSVFEIRDVPRAAAEAAAAQAGGVIRVEIVESAPAPAVDVEALKAEKERLLARIAEIDAILASLS